MGEATRSATLYTHLGIETADTIGHGHGPLNHLHPIVTRNVPQYVPPLVYNDRLILTPFLDLRRVSLTRSLAR